MTKVKTRPLTRQKSDAKYGEGPASYLKRSQKHLPAFNPLLLPFKNTDLHSSISLYCQQIKKKVLIVIWQSVNLRLHLISTKSTKKMIRNLLQLVKDINRKHNKAAAKRNLANKQDSLFNIAGCSCSLEVLP